MGVDYLNSEEIYHGRAFNVWREQVRLPDGHETSYDVVHHPGAVTLVPVDDQGNVWFVRQYRSGVRQTLLELPAGTLEPGEDPDLAAAREIREEIGMAAKRLEKIGEAFLAPGYSTEYMHFYLATGLYESPLGHDEDEFLEPEHYSIAETYAMVGQGKLPDGKTLAALLLARSALKAQFPGSWED